MFFGKRFVTACGVAHIQLAVRVMCTANWNIGLVTYTQLFNYLTYVHTCRQATDEISGWWSLHKPLPIRHVEDVGIRTGRIAQVSCTALWSPA